PSNAVHRGPGRGPRASRAARLPCRAARGGGCPRGPPRPGAARHLTERAAPPFGQSPATLLSRRPTCLYTGDMTPADDADDHSDTQHESRTAPDVAVETAPASPADGPEGRGSGGRAAGTLLLLVLLLATLG